MTFQPNREDLAWAGGFFEGEGCFTMGNARRKRTALAAVNNTDLSSLERFHRAVQLGRINGPYGPYATNSKEQWRWACEGYERTQALLALLWPFLSERRKTRAVEVLSLHGSRKVA